MENEANQEFFRRSRNKISLAVWVLLNNNIVTPSMYYIFLLVDFVVNLVMILCLYHAVGSIPSFSQDVIDLLDFSTPLVLAIVSIAIFAVIAVLLGTMCLLIFKDFSWKTYTEKSGTFQIMSLLMTLIKLPLFSIVVLLIVDSFGSFQNIDNIYVRYVSTVCTILNACGIGQFAYIGAYLFKIQLPNELAPWSDTTHQPAFYGNLFKILLVLTLRLRYQSLILLYTLVLA